MYFSTVEFFISFESRLLWFISPNSKNRLLTVSQQLFPNETKSSVHAALTEPNAGTIFWCPLAFSFRVPFFLFIFWNILNVLSLKLESMTWPRNRIKGNNCRSKTYHRLLSCCERRSVNRRGVRFSRRRPTSYSEGDARCDWGEAMGRDASGRS